LCQDNNIIEILRASLTEKRGKQPVTSTFEKNRQEAKKEVLFANSSARIILVATMRKLLGLSKADCLNENEFDAEHAKNQLQLLQQHCKDLLENK
jgi:hypothetical protein